MDRGWSTPPEVNSFHHDEDQHLGSPDSGKKRKLQYEQLALPMSKHKFRSRCSSPTHGSPNTTHLETEETTEESTDFGRTNRKLDDGSDRSEGSSKDSHSLIAGDDEVHTEMSSGNPIMLSCEPTASSCWQHEDSGFRSKLYSLDSRMPKNADAREKYYDLENEIQVEPESEDVNEQLPDLGAYGDYTGECPDAAIEELMLYSNDVAPNTFVHPSGSWGLEQDARVGARKKPTIDQEFEQYFSMLML